MHILYKTFVVMPQLVLTNYRYLTTITFNIIITATTMHSEYYFLQFWALLSTISSTTTYIHFSAATQGGQGEGLLQSSAFRIQKSS